VALRFRGASPDALAPERRLPGRFNYLIGKDRFAWQTGLPTYGVLVYRGLWPGRRHSTEASARRQPENQPQPSDVTAQTKATLTVTALPPPVPVGPPLAGLRHEAPYERADKGRPRPHRATVDSERNFAQGSS
jgi:hypothetical protein